MSTYYDSAITQRIQGDTEFRDWVERVHDAIEGAGLVQTADTGQIDRATVAAPTTSFEVMGYEMFRFDDTEQANLPIYIKVEYGSGFISGADARPGCWFTAGTGTNGAGTLTGQVTSRRRHGTSGTAQATAQGVRASAGEGYFALVIGSDTGSTRQVGLWIERSRSNGTPTDDFFMLTEWSGTDGDDGSVVPISGTIRNGTDPPLAPLGQIENVLYSEPGTATDPTACAYATVHEKAKDICRGMIAVYEGGTAGDILEVVIQGETLTFLQCADNAGTINIAGSGHVMCIAWPGGTPNRTVDLGTFVSTEAGGGGGGGGAAPPTVIGQLWPR